jgi:HAMP domain-containing protein
MASYLLVAGLVFLPTFVYLRSFLMDELREAAKSSMERELDALVSRLSTAPDDELPEVIRLILESMPDRATIVDATGRVLGDTARFAGELENHSERPEIKDAFARGAGSSERESATTREVRIYVARRFPVSGPPKGVVRLSVPTSQIRSAVAKGFSFLNKAGAVSLSAAVLLSLLAAVVVSRPLMRVAQAARAFGAGDFGHPLEIDSNDELGEVAQAFRDLAAQLKGTLLASGADRATLHGLIDEIPLALILYDSKKAPVAINGAAREACDLQPSEELDRARRIAELPSQAEAIARSQLERRAARVDLSLPWAPARILEAIWVSVWTSNGEPQIGLVLRDKEQELRIEATHVTVQRITQTLRSLASEMKDPTIAARVEHAADELEGARPLPEWNPRPLDSVEIGKLCASAMGDFRARADSSGVRVELELTEPSLRVVEADGRCRQAVRRLVEVAVRGTERGACVRVRGEVATAHVRLSVLTTGKKAKVGRVADLVHCLGGDAGSDHHGEMCEAWLMLPRA